MLFPVSNGAFLHQTIAITGVFLAANFYFESKLILPLVHFFGT